MWLPDDAVVRVNLLLGVEGLDRKQRSVRFPTGEPQLVSADRACTYYSARRYRSSNFHILSIQIRVQSNLHVDDFHLNFGCTKFAAFVYSVFNCILRRYSNVF